MKAISPPVVRQALAFARQRHQGQLRKGDGQPFIVHPKAVVRILARYRMPAHVVAAGALHDVLEDTPTTVEELNRLFGRRITALVREVTEPGKPHPWEVRKSVYLKQLRRASRGALAIACADKLHNTVSLLSAHRRQGPAVFDRFSRSIDQKLAYEHQARQIIRRRWPDCPMLADLERASGRLEKLGRQFLNTQPQEKEVKFLVRKESTLNRIAGLRAFGPFRRTRSFREKQLNRYWDTPDFRLRRARVALKVRQVGRRAEVSFKRQMRYQAGISERIELTVRLPAGQRAAREAMTRRSPVEPVRQARKIIGPRLLTEVLTLRTDRRRMIFTAGKEAVEIDLDRVGILKGDRLLGMHLEVELENRSAGPDRFREALAALRRQFRGEVRISRVSKYETGLRLLQWKKGDFL